MKRKSAGTAHYCAPREIKQWQGNIKCLSTVPQILLGLFLQLNNKLLKTNHGFKCMLFKNTFSINFLMSHKKVIINL